MIKGVSEQSAEENISN